MFRANSSRYQSMIYRRCGASGLKLSALSLGLWHNFGGTASRSGALRLVTTAFDHGITHFDLANNYGPPPGSAETTFGRIVRRELAAYRDELIISTKAGYTMGPGPYGDGGSRKYLLSSLDQSLRRLGLDYVDIFYHHRPDPETPLAETMGALDAIVRSGKALYVGLSNYNAAELRAATAVLHQLGTPCLISQPNYSLLDRWAETEGLFEALTAEGVGSIVYSPLEQGRLSDRYLHGLPASSRAVRSGIFLKPQHITPELLATVRALTALAQARGQSLAQMALAWVLRPQAPHQVTSALIGASQPEQILENLGALNNLDFSSQELAQIETLLGAGA